MEEDIDHQIARQCIQYTFTPMIATRTPGRSGSIVCCILYDPRSDFTREEEKPFRRPVRCCPPSLEPTTHQNDGDREDKGEWTKGPKPGPVRKTTHRPESSLTPNDGDDDDSPGGLFFVRMQTLMQSEVRLGCSVVTKLFLFSIW
jgi:hypothetical protein